MISLINGNLLESNADALVNTVNCVGVMGKGIALQFKRKYPKMFNAYQIACERKEICPGKIWIYKSNLTPIIICFPTKQHWYNPSKIEWISEGLDDLRNYILHNNIESIAIPALGCANGGLKFSDVKPLIYEKLENLTSVQISLYNPK